MKKKIISVIVTGVITMSPLLTTIGNAETLDSIQEKQSKVEKQKEEAQQQISEMTRQSSDLEAEMEKLDKSIVETQGNIEGKQAEIEQQKKGMEKLQQDIQTLYEKIEQRIELLKERAVAYQQSGGSVSYIQVLLGSKSFSDLISRIDVVKTIMDADKTLIEQHESEIRLVEEKEKQEAEKQAMYKKQLEKLKELEDSLREKSEEKEKILKQLGAQKQEVQEDIFELEKQEEFLKEQKAAIKKAAEEASRKANEERQKGQNKQSSENNQNNNGGGNTPTITAGLFMRPANGPVTSEFGGRTLNGSADDHSGIDIGKRGANVPIVAAADGVVIRSYYSTSYGNAVFITHNLNGKVYTTVYAHMEKRFVQSGQTVKKGQQIGLMGNTGNSFGAHLHFEIHRGQWNAQKSNAVNPRNYINF